MIWWLTKSNHELAINSWVRAWLRAGALTRLVVLLCFTAVLGVLSSTLGLGASMLMRRNELWDGFLAVFGVVTQLAWVFWLADSAIEKWVVNNDLKTLTASPNVVLATRGEYIGGHPKLPHGRFVYLSLSGVLENPNLTIVLPGEHSALGKAFPMPVLDLHKTTARAVQSGPELGAVLVNIVFHTKFGGRQQALLDIDYIGQAGRKQRVQIGEFWGGNGEIQMWRNYIVCIQAEADTGEKPYGPWNSLPSRSGTPAKP